MFYFNLLNRWSKLGFAVFEHPVALGCAIFHDAAEGPVFLALLEPRDLEHIVVFVVTIEADAVHLSMTVHLFKVVPFAMLKTLELALQIHFVVVGDSSQ